MFNLIEDISKLSNISISTLKNINSLGQNIISHDVLESVIKNNEKCIIDIGIGDLIIKRIEDNITYKFIPCEDLENKLIKVFNNKKSPLKEEIDKTLGKRVNDTYKNLF